MSKQIRDDAAMMLESLAQGKPQRGDGQQMLAGLQAPEQPVQTLRLQARQPAIKPEKTIALSTYIRPAVHKKLRRMAFELDRTMSSLVDEALGMFVEQNQP